MALRKESLKSVAREGISTILREVKVQCQNGQLQAAVALLDLTNERDSELYLEACGFVLQTCMKMQALSEGRQMHSNISKSSLRPNLPLWNMLISMYAKCGSLEEARQVFNRVPEKNMFIWTTMIASYSQQCNGREAIKLFGQMQLEGVKSDRVTYVSILSACACASALALGKMVHANTLKSGCGFEIVVMNTLIDMYAKCSYIESACEIFVKMPVQNVVSWSAVIAGYGEANRALQLFWQMQLDNVKPDRATFLGITSVCATTTTWEIGKLVHSCILKTEFFSDIVTNSALLHMYAKCGSMDDAQIVFSVLSKLDVVSYSAMIAGLSQVGKCKDALQLFKQMHLEHVKPNEIAFVNILTACATASALEAAKQIHAEIVKEGCHLNVFVGSALVHMYASCGNMDSACQVFDRIHSRNVVSWNALITGYAQHGHAHEAIKVFEKMHLQSVKPNKVSITSALCACSHGCLLDEGFHFFSSASLHRGITPSVEHYVCMVDLLGRVGYLSEAEDFVNRFPYEANDYAQTSFFGGCKTYNHLKFAESLVDCIESPSVKYRQ